MKNEEERLEEQNEQEEERVKGGIYLRLSREDGDDKEESNSITNQRMMLGDFANSHNIEIIDEYVDDGYTGTNFNRPGWKRLMEDCQTGRVECILVKDLSRMGRNTIECGKYLESTFPAWGTRVIALNDLFDSEKLYDPISRMTVMFKNLMNDFYCSDMSAKVKAGIHAKMKRGDFIGSWAPYGYKKDPENRNHLIVEESEAEVVRRIFRLKISGMNPKNIAKLLNDEKIPSPAVKKGLSTRSKWKDYTIHTILKNEVYLGNMVQGKTRKLSYKSKKVVKVGEEDQIRVKRTHESIIGWHTFEFVQELIGNLTRAERGSNRVSLLAGFLRCGDCGQNMHRYTPRKIAYFHCSEYVYNKNLCTSHCTAEKKLVKAVDQAVRRQLALLHRVNKAITEKGIMPKRQRQVKEIDEKITQDIDQISDARKHQADLFRSMMEQVIDQEEYADMEKRFRNKISDAEKDIQQLQRRRQEVVDEIEYLVPWLESVLEFENFEKLDRTIVTLLIHHIDVFEDNRIVIRFHFEEDIEEILEELDFKERNENKVILLNRPSPVKVDSDNVKVVMMEGLAV